MSARPLVTAEDIRLARRAGQTSIPVPPGAIVTQQAREDAAESGIALAEASASAETAPKAPVAAVSPVPVVVTDAPVVAAQDAVRQLLETGQAMLRLAASLAAKPEPVPSPESVPALLPVPPAVQTTPPVQAAHPDNCVENLFTEVRKQVLAALPVGTDTRPVDDLIRKTLAQTACGNGCPHCPRTLPATQAASAAEPWLMQSGGVRRVDSQGLSFKTGSDRSGAIGLMPVLAGTGPFAVSYLKLDAGHCRWTFEQDEVLVVLQGRLEFAADGATFRAESGDVCSFAAGTEVIFTTNGPTLCASVATNA